jgi:arylsulfatase A-like enzyme
MAAGLALGLLGAAASLSLQIRTHRAGDGWAGFEGALLTVHLIAGLVAGVLACRFKNQIAAVSGLWLALWTAVVMAFKGKKELFELGVYTESVWLTFLLVMLALMACMLVGGILYNMVVGMIARKLRLRPEALAIALAVWAVFFFARGYSITGAIIGMVAAAVTLWIFTKAVKPRSRQLWTAAILAVLWIAPLLEMYRANRALPTAAEKGMPNVVLIVVDTVRTDHLTGIAGSALELPAWRRLAGNGFTFNETVATSSFTVASTASILTALIPHHHGARTHPSDLPERVTTLAEALWESGYATGGMVCNGLLSWNAGFGQGFDRFVDVRGGVLGSSPALYLANIFTGLFQDGLGLRDVPDFRRLRWMFKAEPDHDAIATDLAIDWLDGQGEGPFFLWVHYFGPHMPYEPRPSAEDDESRQAAYEEFGTMMREYYLDNRSIGSVNFENPLSPEGREVGAHLYGREVEQADGEIGRLVEHLESRGLLESTLFVVTSDHGESLGEHDLVFAHAYYVYDVSTIVPTVFYWPGEIEGGMESDEQVSILDIMPTILELAGIESESGEGTSLAGGLRGGALPEMRPMLSESIPLLPRHPERKRIHLPGNAGKMRALREFPWKLIATPKEEGVDWELYRLDEDPGEKNNLAGSGADVEPGLRARMLAILELEAAEEAQDLDEPIDEEQLELLKSLGYIN